jgi:hypothetical protein
MQHARSTLRKIFSDALRREGASAPLLAWPLACGATTAARANAVAFAEGVLTVEVPDKTWRQQLQSFGPRYLAALNQISAEPVSRIDFVIAGQSQR